MDFGFRMRITHSEVEKRRREKMNKFLFDLAPYLPISSNGNVNNAKKLDKITILKMAVQHMKFLKSCLKKMVQNFFKL